MQKEKIAKVPIAKLHTTIQATLYREVTVIIGARQTGPTSHYTLGMCTSNSRLYSC